MEFKLSDVEIEILRKLSIFINDEKERINIWMYNLAGEVDSEIEIGYYIQSLLDKKFIMVSENLGVRRDKSMDYKGSNITKVDFKCISISFEGRDYLERYENYIETKKSDKRALEMFNSKHEQYAQAIKVMEDDDSYVRISIKTDYEIIDDILMDKELLPRLQEYSWIKNKDGMIISKHHYKDNKRRNISIDQILFEEALKEEYISSGNKHLVHFKNYNNMDKRRCNARFVTRAEQSTKRNFDRITGISSTLFKTDTKITYEVSIKKNKELIYLTKTQNYREAFFGAYFLRLIFWGKEYCNVFIERLSIYNELIEKLHITVERYKNDFSEKELVKTLEEFYFSNRFIKRILKVIFKKKHLIAY